MPLLITHDRRSALYFGLAAFMFCVTVLAGLAAGLTAWSTVSTSAGAAVHYNIWGDCTDDSSAWTTRSCQYVNKYSQDYDGLYQSIRAFILLAVGFGVVAMWAAVYCAFQRVITIIVPIVTAVAIFFVMLFSLLSWIFWLIIAGSTARSLKNAGTSDYKLAECWILAVVVFCLSFLALLLAVYLILAKEAVPVEYAAEYPVVAEYPAYSSTYAAAPATYAPTYTAPMSTYAPTYAPTYSVA